MGLPPVSRNTKLLGIASLLTDLSSEMVYPLLPFFMTSMLGAPVYAVGLMESLGEFVTSVFGFLSGIYADRIGKRKRIVVFGYSLSALFKAFLLVVASWKQMVVLRMLERTGKGLRDVPRDALMGLSEEKANMGNAFGFRKMMDNIGALLGPMAASMLILVLFNNSHTNDAYRTIFALSLVPAGLAVVSLLFVRDPSTERTKPGEIFAGVMRTPNFRELVVAGMVFALGQFSMMLFLLRANDFMPLVLVPLAYLAYNVFYTIFAVPAGVLADRFGAKKALLVGMLCFLAALCGFAFFPSQSMIFAMFMLLGLFMAIAETAPQILLIRTVDRRCYASAIGSWKGLIGLVALPANLIAGFLYMVPVMGTPASFLFSIATSVLGIILLLALVKE